MLHPTMLDDVGPTMLASFEPAIKLSPNFPRNNCAYCVFMLQPGLSKVQVSTRRNPFPTSVWYLVLVIE